jgi:carbonic anhydrase
MLRSAEAYAEGFDKGDLPAPPARRVAVLTCMDARLAPMRLLGLDEGEAHVIRNAGGVVSDDAIRSLSISQTLLGTEEVVVIQHTDCGMRAESDDHLRQRLADAVGEEPGFPIHSFADVDESVRESLDRLRKSQFIPNKDSIRGFVYEVETGKLREVT